MVNEGIMLVMEEMLVAKGVNGGLSISLKIAYHDVDIPICLCVLVVGLTI